MPDVSKLPNKLQRHLKNVISPLLIKLLKSKDSEAKAAALSVLGALSNLQSYEATIESEVCKPPSPKDCDYKLNLAEHLELFRTN